MFNFSFTTKDRKSLEALMMEMQNNGKIVPLSKENPWNKYLADAIQQEWTWNSAPWWFVENYMYRRITDITDGARVTKGDPFQKQKEESLKVHVLPGHTLDFIKSSPNLSQHCRSPCLIYAGRDPCFQKFGVATAGSRAPGAL